METKHLDKRYTGDEYAGETWSEFWTWWKAECAARDAKPKQIARSVRWMLEDKKRGKRK